MRHGRRGCGVDAPLADFNYNDLDHCCPEVWRTVKRLSGLPFNHIITSPYLRTRQTAQLVQYGFLKLTGRLLPISVDNRVGEYLQRRCTWKAPLESEFDGGTLQAYNNLVPLCRESVQYFIKRVYSFYCDLTPHTLVITHAGVAGLLGDLCQQSVKLDVGECALLETCNKLMTDPVQ